ncbi:hypothetical protein Prum_047740 [Phytohabitans rumicis]|uniref:Pyridoxamine 5'-phosphate oxidase putative domain-containing protein n=1 Tax=Phytohabitans rumicis TaxID=1076125 RepID=A0A6V8L1H1_9ACTN|nr:hypothetical protein Prum_047740 [Phytohabitans rumicis]
MPDPLIAEAMKKASVAWVAVGDGPALALWCLPLDDALYVVSGPGEQSAPGLAIATAAEVRLRGDHGGRIVTWPAEVTRVDPRSEEWATVAPNWPPSASTPPAPRPPWWTAGRRSAQSSA